MLPRARDDGEEERTSSSSKGSPSCCSMTVGVFASERSGEGQKRGGIGGGAGARGGGARLHSKRVASLVVCADESSAQRATPEARNKKAAARCGRSEILMGDDKYRSPCDVVRQSSQSSCTLGTTFGCEGVEGDTRAVWIAGGCRGIDS